MQVLLPELREALILHLPPRHLYKIMQTNKQFLMCCRSEAYWSRVAFYLMNTCMWFSEISFLSASYRDAMDTFIQKRASSHNFLKKGEETMFALVKRYVQHTDHIEYAMARCTLGTEELRQKVDKVTKRLSCDTLCDDGFITGERRANRAMSCFLRSLEADTRMDLSTKMSVVEYTKKLLEDVYEHRVTLPKYHPPLIHPVCELLEEPIDASYIHF